MYIGMLVYNVYYYIFAVKSVVSLKFNEYLMINLIENVLNDLNILNRNLHLLTI